MVTTPKVAPNTKKNYKYKHWYYSAAKPVTKSKCIYKKPEGNMKLCKNQLLAKILYYVKQRCLLVQVAGSPTNISQLQKEPKHQSKWVYPKTFWSILKVSWFKVAAHVTCPCNTKEHQNYLTIFQNYWGIYIYKKMVLFTTYKMSKHINI